MPSPGFLGTGAPLSADITLAIEIAMGVALLLGMVLARRQRYRAHAWCQSTVVVLNLIVIAHVMLPTFRSQVAPKIPARLARPYYAVATGHATMGCIAELLGVYIILVAGTRIVPERLRFASYKPWMRTELVIWWLALLLGLTTYVRWYIAPQQTAPTGTVGMLTKAQPRGERPMISAERQPFQSYERTAQKPRSRGDSCGRFLAARRRS